MCLVSHRRKLQVSAFFRSWSRVNTNIRFSNRPGLSIEENSSSPGGRVGVECLILRGVSYRNQANSVAPEAGLTETAGDQVTAKLTLVMEDQRANALLAAPTTSLPAFMLEPGDNSELENATAIVRLGHLICRTVWADGSSS